MQATNRRRLKKLRKWVGFAALFIGLSVVGLSGPGAFSWVNPQADPDPAELQVRDAALTRAKVFRAEPFDAARVDFAADPNRELINPADVTCRFLAEELSGTTPKFDCELPGGQKIKVKYFGTREIPAEVAATRLLHGMGFGADHMSRVETVHCYGCVMSPFHIRSLMQKLWLLRTFDEHIDYDEATVFTKVGVERKLKGESIEVGEHKGWGFYELSRIDPTRGGATKPELDAFRLMAMFLNHWDNKASNQRLMCPGSESDDCEHPLAMLQDVGSDFGPRKINLGKWSETQIWSDAKTCTVSMKDFPYDGGTFKDAQISEEGRLLLGLRLKQLSPAQIESLFTSAGFDDVPQWVAAFQSKVRQIADRPACPSSPASS
jgi:hypothetical protein